jgi:hypothetical protein
LSYGAIKVNGAARATVMFIGVLNIANGQLGSRQKSEPKNKNRKVTSNPDGRIETGITKKKLAVNHFCSLTIRGVLLSLTHVDRVVRKKHAQTLTING